MRRFLAALLTLALTANEGARAQQQVPYFRLNPNITPGNAPRILTLKYPAGPMTARAGEQFTITPTVTGLYGPGTYAAATAMQGLSLSSNGQVLGYVASPGTVPSYVVSLTDDKGKTVVSQTPVVNVLAQLRFAYPSVLTGVRGAQFAAAPLVWDGVAAPRVEILSGGVPAGLSLNPSTGLISGVPTSPGTSSVTFALVDTSDGRQVSAGETTFVISDSGPLSLNLSTLPTATVNRPYAAFAVPVSGGRAPFALSLASGALPPGMNLSNGSISGTPTQEGDYPFGIRATDFDGRTITSTGTMRVVHALVVNAPALPRGTVGTPLPAATFQVDNATGSSTWSAISLPPGLEMSPEGGLSGTPTAAGSYPSTVTVTDSLSRAASANVTIHVDEPLEARAPTLPMGALGTSYAQRSFTSVGGNGTVTWSAAGVPTGMTLTTAGRLQGTPTQSGSFTVRATARDASGRAATAEAPLEVSATFAISTSSMPAAIVGSAYGPISLAAAGGESPYDWQISQGSLPAGVNLSSTGQVSGTPTEAAVSSFTVRATDAGGAHAERSFTVSAAAPISLTGPSALSRGTTGTPLQPAQVPFAATGGRGGVTLAASNLHPGLSLSNGFVTGTPTAAGTRTVTVTARDADNRTSTLSLPLAVDAALSVPNATLPSDVAGAAMAPYGVTASGGRTPYVWSLPNAQALHVGVDMNESGVVTGTPTSSGTRSFQVAVVDADGRTASGSISHTVDPSPTHPSISGAPPSSVVSGTSIDASPFTVSGGQGPYSFSVSSGYLPPGIALSSTGRFTGSASYSGTWSFTVSVRDALGRVGQAGPFAVQASGSYTITGSLPSKAKVGQPYSAQFYVTAAPTSGQFFAYRRTGSSSWGSRTQTVVPGVVIDRVTGAVTGTPTTPGTYTGIEIWHDVGSWTGIGTFTVTVDP